MATQEAEAKTRHRLALMRPGWAYVIFDREFGEQLCAGGWATRDRLGYYRATDAGVELGGRSA